jgi:hypothetical protein
MHTFWSENLKGSDNLADLCVNKMYGKKWGARVWTTLICEMSGSQGGEY